MSGSQAAAAIRAKAVGREADDELRQRALALWLPARASEVLCVVYGRSALPLVLAERSSDLYLISPDEGWAAAQRDEAVRRGWTHVHPLPDRTDLTLPGVLDAAIVLGAPGSAPEATDLPAPSRFLDRAAAAFRALRPGGTLLVAWETAAGVLLSGRGRPRVWPAARWSRAIGAGLRAALPGLAPRRAELIRVYPTLTRPLLLASRHAPARLKRLALGHAGRLRWPASVRSLAPFGSVFLPDLLPPALLWRLEK